MFFNISSNFYLLLSSQNERDDRRNQAANVLATSVSNSQSTISSGRGYWVTDKEESIGDKRKKLAQEFWGRTGEFGRRGRYDGGSCGSARYRDDDYDEDYNHDSGRNGSRHAYDDGKRYRDGCRNNEPRHDDSGRNGEYNSQSGDGGKRYRDGWRNDEPRHDDSGRGGDYNSRSGDGGKRYRDGGSNDEPRHDDSARGGDHNSRSGDGGDGYRDGGRDDEPRVARNRRVENTQRNDTDDERSERRSGGGDIEDRDANDRLIPEFIVRDNKNNA